MDFKKYSFDCYGDFTLLEFLILNRFCYKKLQNVTQYDKILRYVTSVKFKVGRGL